MRTSRNTSILSEVLTGDRIPLGTLSYFRERFRDRLYDLVLSEFHRRAVERGMTKAEVARRIGRRPEQITRWFGAPGNWTLETVSDLLLAVAKAEPEVTLLPLEGRAARNDRGQGLRTLETLELRERTGPRLPGSAMEANNLLGGPSASQRPVDARQSRSVGPLAGARDSGGRREAARY